MGASSRTGLVLIAFTDFLVLEHLSTSWNFYEVELETSATPAGLPTDIRESKSENQQDRDARTSHFLGTLFQFQI